MKKNLLEIVGSVFASLYLFVLVYLVFFVSRKSYLLALLKRTDINTCTRRTPPYRTRSSCTYTYLYVLFIIDSLFQNSVVILDVSYQMKPKTDPAEFKEKYYGRFEEIMAEKVELAKLRFFNASSVAAGFNFPRNCGEPASKFLQEEHKKKLR